MTLTGTLPRKGVGPIFVRLCEDVDGVVEVVDRLVYGEQGAADPSPGSAAQESA